MLPVAAVVWPAHERHMATSVAPLGARVTRHPAPATDAQVGAIVEAILQQLRAGVSVPTTAFNGAAQPSAPPVCVP